MSFCSYCDSNAFDDDDIEFAAEDVVDLCQEKRKIYGYGAIDKHKLLGLITEEYHELIQAITDDKKNIGPELKDLGCLVLLGLAACKEAR